jgi:kinesin family protein 6/9
MRVCYGVLRAGVDGTTLKEAKYINLSLHYLEQVIIALQERSMGIARYACHWHLTCLAFD